MTKNITKKLDVCFGEILKDTNFRREVTSVLTRKLANTAKLPNFVVVFGTDFELHVKYSKTTLMQLLING